MHYKIGNDVDLLAKELKQLSQINVYDCYQCGKCSAGCTVGSFITDSPTRLIRLIQLNRRDEVLNSQTPYICASCITCSERCPMEIDVAKLMETIRIIAKRDSIPSPAKSVQVFNQVFLDSIKANGRLFEFGMTLGFNLKNLTPMKDALLAPLLLKKGKLSFRPQRSGKKRIKKLFKKSRSFVE